MGSCKIKSRLYNFFLQGKNQGTAWGPLIVLWSRKGFPSLALPFVARKSFSRGIRLAAHHRCCCPWWLPWYQHLQKCWISTYSWAAPMVSPGFSSRTLALPQGAMPQLLKANSVPGSHLWLRLSLPTASHGLSRCQVPAALHNPVSPAALVHQDQLHVGDSYKWTNLAVSFMCSLGPLWTTASVCWSWETLCSRLCSSDAGLFLLRAAEVATADQCWLFQQSRGLALVGFWSLLITLIFSPSWPEPQILASKILVDPSTVFKSLSSFPLKLHKLTFIVCVSSRIFTF